MSTFEAEHAVRSHSFVVNLPVERAFTLFEPEGERAWAQGWDPQYVWPRDGRAQPGMVFTTAHGGESTIWTMIRHEPKTGLVEYLRVTPGSRIASVIVQCAALDARRARATVIYAMTALSDTGNKFIREMDEARYREYIGEWEAAIAKVAGK
jgi:hypothetical protein